MTEVISGEKNGTSRICYLCRMHYLRLVLLPLSLLYGLVILMRNRLYDSGIFRSHSFPLPVISIGNLALGGAGKSPMAEYLIRMLQDRYRVAVLSRGYKRETRGFRIVETHDRLSDAGDEPLQFKRKFKDITVAVAEKRVEGVRALKENHDLVILDDAFQHRAVKPGLSILLFDYKSLAEPLLVLPAGNLREPFAGRERADVLVVTKCPEPLTPDQKAILSKRIKPFAHQKVFFSYLEYGNLISFHSGEEKTLQSVGSATIFLLTGIVNPKPLAEKLASSGAEIIHHEYPDHHPFTIKNISKLATAFAAHSATNKLIVTTEKDAQRLFSEQIAELLRELPVYYLPVSTRFDPPSEAQFNSIIEDYVTKHIQHNNLH